MKEIIYEIFGIKGYEPYLEKYNPNFKVRVEQNKLVYDMLKAFETNNKHILMEAPTGTGKTFIYTYISIVEYILKMVRLNNKISGDDNYSESDFNKIINGNKIVIVTNNKSLQKQVYEDILNVILPSLSSYFEYKEMYEHKSMLEKLKLGIYKSRSNYLCRKALDKDKSSNENFYDNILKEIELQGEDSVDFDLIDKYYPNGKVKYSNKDFDTYNAKDRNCGNCKVEKCRFRSNKKKQHNIMITNYDYLLLLSKKISLGYIHTLILDEVHNLPNKLIGISSDEFNLNNLIMRLPKYKDDLNNNFLSHLNNLLKYTHTFKPKTVNNYSDSELVNLTYGISQNEKNLENYINKKLNIVRVKSVLNNEVKKVTEHLRNIYFRELNDIIDIYNGKVFKNFDIIFEEINKVTYIDNSSVLKSYDKFIPFKELSGMEEYIEKKEKEITVTLTDSDVETLDELFKSDNLIKDTYNECKNLLYCIKNLYLYSRISSEMRNYILYINDLIEKLDNMDYEVKERLVPDVITLEIDKELKVNFYIMNDDTKTTYQQFLKTINNVRHIVYCSATMSIEGDYSFFIDRLGLLKDSTYKCYIPSSPFDKFNKRYIFLDKDYCLDKFGKETKYKWLLEKKIHNIAKSGDSGSLILCTSKSDVDNTYKCLKDNLNSDYSIHSQYFSALPTIVHDMNKNIEKNTIVVGNTGFWEGIDFKGDNMTNLVITKLPYMRVNEPSIVSKFDRLLFDKIENKSKKSFIGEYWNYYNNMMKIVFYQGVGRLIRSVTDYGVVVCLFSYENFSRKFNVSIDKHLGIDNGIVLEATDLTMLEGLINSSVITTKENRKKYL